MPRMPEPPGGGAKKGGVLPGLPQVKLKPEPKAGDPVAEALGKERDLGAPVTAAVAVGGAFWFAAGDGQLWNAADGLAAAVPAIVHRGAILSAVAKGSAVLSGGDDGRVIATDASGPKEVFVGPPSRWIDHVAAHANGTCAWSCGKVVTVRQDNGETRDLTLPSSVGGLAFGPKSGRLAIAHYGGATLWDLAADTTQVFTWKGSHLEILWSPDEKYIVTAMQEGSVHGWRTSDGADFAMRGYPGKPRSLSFSRDGLWLATSGAFEAVLWPFVGKGPMGKAPMQLARRTHMATAVAFHPLNAYVAVGYQDGLLLLVRPEDRRELMVRRAGKAPLSVITWATDGKRLAYGTEDGIAGAVDFSAIG